MVWHAFGHGGPKQCIIGAIALEMQAQGIKGTAMPLAAVRGARIYYEITGRGAPLVLATGQGTGPEGRAALVDALAERFQVLSYDQRGTGRSERAAQGQPIEDLAEDLVGLMDAADFKKAHVMGISTGTGMVTCVAALHQARVDKLVLAAPWTHGDPELHVLQNLRKAAARTMPPDHYVQLNALLIYSPEFRKAHAARLAGYAEKALASPQDAAGIAARLDAILAFDARPLYARITAPTLVVGARDDLVMPYWHAKLASTLIPRATLSTIEEGGHLFSETRTGEFVRTVSAFLN